MKWFDWLKKKSKQIDWEHEPFNEIDHPIMSELLPRAAAVAIVSLIVLSALNLLFGHGLAPAGRQPAAPQPPEPPLTPTPESATASQQPAAGRRFTIQLDGARLTPPAVQQQASL